MTLNDPVAGSPPQRSTPQQYEHIYAFQGLQITSVVVLNQSIIFEAVGKFFILTSPCILEMERYLDAL
jgi:hypothetical protein